MSAEMKERRCPNCDVPMEWKAASIGHMGDLYRCPKCKGYTFRGDPVGPRN